jgi:hypothetical protein
VGLAAVWYFTSAVLRRKASEPAGPSQARAAVTAATLLAAIGAAVVGLRPAWSQPPETGTVLILPGPPGAPHRQDVLVTPDLLKRLDNLVLRGPTSLRGAVLVGASYEGQWTGEGALFKAEFVVHSFSDKATLNIPLTGVELRQGALLDGAPVEPLAAPAGYTILVKDKGPHTLTLLFSVRVQATPEHRDLRFTVPRLHLSRLALQLPVALPETQVLSGSGQTHTTTTDAASQRLAVDLGRDGIVHLRWPQINPVAPAGRAKVREMYFWDLRGPGSECTAVLDYSISAGGISHFVMAIPETLEPRAVEVAGPGSGGDESGRPSLKNWYLAQENGQWRLHVLLHNPATGSVTVTLRLVSRQPVGVGALQLTLPLPLEAQLAGGWLAYRALGFDVTEKAFNVLTLSIPADQFAQQWQASGPREPVLPTRAFSFRNHQAGAGLTLTLSPLRPAVDQDLLWQFHPDRAELLATLKVASTEDLLLVEWEIPALVTLAQITGDNIHFWTRGAGDARLQIWLKQPARNVVLNLRGWMLYTKPPAGQPLRWTTPWLRCPDAAGTRTVLRVEGRGVRAEPDSKKFVNLAALPSPASSWLCPAPQGFYRADFLLQPVALPPRVLGVTGIEMRDGALDLTGHWQLHVPHSGPAAFQVRVVNWQGSPLKLEGPGDPVIRPLPAPPGEQVWQIDVTAGAPRRLHLKLTGRQPSKPGIVVDMPRFELESAVWSDHWLTVHTPGLEVRTSEGLIPVLGGDAEPGLPASVADRLRRHWRAWKIAAMPWHLQVQALSPVAMPGAQVLLAEHEAAFGEGHGWIHQATYWVYVRDSYELTMEMPGGAFRVTATVDGEQVNPRFVTSDRLTVALPPGEGLRRVRLRWVFEPPAGRLPQPQLTPPRLEGMAAVPVNWTVLLPPGYRVGNDAAGGEPAAALENGRQELARAEAMATASRLLSEQYLASPDEAIKPQILGYQTHFARHCRLAGNHFEQATAAGATTELRLRLLKLQEQNAATLRSAGLDKLRGQAEKLVPAAEKGSKAWQLPGRGTPLRWQTISPAPAPALELISAEADARRQAWVHTVWLVGVAAALLILSWFPRAITVMQQLWPEQIALVACFVWAAWGFSILPSLLLGLAVVARLLLAVPLWRRLLTRFRLAAAGSGKSLG